MGSACHAPSSLDAATLRALATEVADDLGGSGRTELLELAELALTSLDVAVTNDEPEVYADVLAHLADRLPALVDPAVDPADPGVDPAAFSDAVRRRLRERLAPADAVDVVVRRAEQLASAVEAAAEPSLDPLARDYLDQVLAGRRDRATELVRAAIRAGTDVGDVLVDVLEAAQREIGRRWQAGQLSVAQEHYCTAVTQLVMTELYPFLFSGRPTDQRIVAVNAPGSLHQVGLHMVVDLLERAGWATTCLDAEVGPEQLPDALVEAGATAVAISASMPAQLAAVRSLVAAVREDPRTQDLPVVVGGRLFVVAPSLARTVGADGTAGDARTAVELLATLTGGSRAPR
jgi:methanogenic corrinoid protein MtbC1